MEEGVCEIGLCSHVAQPRTGGAILSRAEGARQLPGNIDRALQTHKTHTKSEIYHKIKRQITKSKIKIMF